MASALLVRFRPAGPWRLGPANGSKSHTERVLGSDSLFSALTIAMRDLGWLEPWLAATAESAAPGVQLSSCFPYSGQTLLIQPPRSVWPPDGGGKVRWKTARFVPVSVIPFLLRGDSLNEDHWAVDPVSESLVPLYRSGPAPAPFRVSQRKLAPIDRADGTSEAAESVACLEFPRGGGMWFVASFEEEVWNERLRAAVRLLADTGVGGGRSRGWGRSLKPEFRTVELPGFLLGDVTTDGGESGWWLLSVFSPAESDAVDWSRGNYCTGVRAGRVQDTAELKPAVRMVSEGSVLLSGTPPVGTARNVAPIEHPHPVYRSGIALAVRIPWQEGQRFSLPVEKAVVAATTAEADVSPEAEMPVEPAEPAAFVSAEGELPVVEATPEPEAPTEPAAEAEAPEAIPEAEAGVSAEAESRENEPAPPKSEVDMDETSKPIPPDEPPVQEPPTPAMPPAEEPPSPTEPAMEEPPGTEEPTIGEPGPEPPPEKAE